MAMNHHHALRAVRASMQFLKYRCALLYLLLIELVFQISGATFVQLLRVLNIGL